MIFLTTIKKKGIRIEYLSTIITICNMREVNKIFKRIWLRLFCVTGSRRCGNMNKKMIINEIIKKFVYNYL